MKPFFQARSLLTGMDWAMDWAELGRRIGEAAAVANPHVDDAGVGEEVIDDDTIDRGPWGFEMGSDEAEFRAV